MKFITSELFITVTYVSLVAFSLMGVGSLALQSLRRWFPEIETGPFESFSLGLLTILIWAKVLNLWQPLGPNHGPALIALGCALFLVNILLSPKLRRPSLSAIFWIILIVLWQGGLKLSEDSLTYHEVAVDSLLGSELSLGTPLDKSRLAFNSSWFTLVAAYSVPGFLSVKQSLITLDLCVRALVIGWIFQEILKGAKAKNYPSLALFSSVFLFVLLFFKKWTGTDVPANLFGLASWLYLSKIIIEEEASRRHTVYSGILISMSLGCVAMTVKLSMFPLLIFSIYFILSGWPRFSFMTRTMLLSLPSTLILLWSVRGFLMSGCWAYPVSFTCLDVSWAIPTDHVSLERQAILSWARFYWSPNPLLIQFWDMSWLSGWSTNILLSKIFFISIIVGSLVFNSRSNIYNYFKQRDTVVWAVLSLITSGLGLLIWFFGGPDPRFSWSFFVMLWATGITLVVASKTARPAPDRALR